MEIIAEKTLKTVMIIFIKIYKRVNKKISKETQVKRVPKF